MIEVVDVESPYNGETEEIIKRNINYARACMKDCLRRDEIPFASHLLYTQPGILDDKIEEERQRGIEAGKEIMSLCDKTVVYTDLGISKGMEFGIYQAQKQERPIEFRQLKEWDEKPTREGW